MRNLSLPRNPLFDLLALGFLLALLFGIGLGDRPYSAPSESRYIEIGREMAESGDFVTPRLDYVKYFEKPPLFYWIQAASTKLLGLDSFAARVPTALFCVLLCLLAYGLGKMLYGRLAGTLGALVLATSLYMFALSRIVLLDVPVSFFMAATLTAFLYAAYAPHRPKRTVALYLMYAFAACAVLTKGLIGAVLPGAVVFLWFACTKRWRLLKELRLISGILLFLLIAVPWHIIVAQRNPEWAHFYFIHEHFERYLTREHGRYQPVWFFIPVLLAGSFPWIVFLTQAAMTSLAGFWRKRFADGRQLFLVLWIGFILFFFSLSDSKLIPYILPVFPPLAALLGRYLANAWQERPAPGFTAGMWALIVLLLLMAIIPPLLPQFLDKENKILVALAQGDEELRLLSIASMMAVGLMFIAYIQGHARHVILASLASAALVLQLADQVAAHYNKDSMFTFSHVIRSVQTPSDEVVSYQTYYQDLPIYLKRRITLAGNKGELEFGATHEDTSAWMISEEEFWRRWLKNDHRIFTVMRQDIYDRAVKDKSAADLRLYLLHREGRNMLFSNRNPHTDR